MRRLLAVAATVVLIAATPQEALPGLEADGYFIEEGSGASEAVVSDAVFQGRSDGGRLYIVVLSEEPPGGAPTFSDSVLDLLGEGYVVTVAPETVGYAGDGSFWSTDEMDRAVDASLTAGSDDAVVQTFIDTLVADPGQGGSAGGDGGGGISIWWVVIGAAVIIGIWMMMSRRSREKRIAGHMDEVKRLAKEKLDEVANDILNMEDEVAVSDDPEVKGHYQRASSMYTKATEDTAKAGTVREMLEVTEELDLAIWELDCAEALLDGKPKPPKPEPPAPVLQPTTPPTQPGSPPPPPDQFDRRPQRQSTGSNDMLTMLMTMMAMGGMRGGGGFGGGFGGFGGGGGGRMTGGGGRVMGGGGRMRGGGRRG